MESTAKEFLRLVNIMDELREKCPWDKKQTIETLRHLTIEETYELADAITDKDWQGIKEELGDLLLHIVFYAKLGAEKNEFTLQEVINGVCEKLIVRHPHIYGDVVVKDDEEVKQNWEKIKLQGGKKSILGGVPQSLPAMVKATRLQEKSKTVGFEWEDKAQVWDKVKEELQELEEAVASGNTDHMEDELGDVFFSLVNFARFLQIDAENALERTNKKFMKRFNGMEAAAKEQNKNLHDMNLEELDVLWNKMKEGNI
ncbi:MAG: nucleoside triphosphate pyrophosphohydrolase [Gloeobacteraceae cyanobacterium ES-bin-316]|nr:nucleoside triphosphate pyrophosphohydrolase [Ferruginibacter sp.]